MKRASALVLMAGVAALAVGAAVALRYDQSSATAPVSANALFAHTFSDVDGRPQAIAQWRGGLLVVNFWATWCAPCIEEMPDLQAVQIEYAQRRVTVIGIAIDNADPVKQFRDRLQLNLPLLIAGAAGSDLARELGNTLGVLPYTVLIDARGHVVRSKVGRLSAEELRGWLQKHLVQAG